MRTRGDRAQPNLETGLVLDRHKTRGLLPMRVAAKCVRPPCGREGQSHRCERPISLRTGRWSADAVQRNDSTRLVWSGDTWQLPVRSRPRCRRNRESPASIARPELVRQELCHLRAAHCDLQTAIEGVYASNRRSLPCHVPKYAKIARNPLDWLRRQRCSRGGDNPNPDYVDTRGCKTGVKSAIWKRVEREIQ